MQSVQMAYTIEGNDSQRPGGAEMIAEDESVVDKM